MNGHLNAVSLTVFALLFALVTVVGFAAMRWRRAQDALRLDEWGLGGRNFGGWVSWFLLGGDLYTAYTFVAVPALLYGAGATGFFAVPYTVVAYPLVFVFLPRLWSVAHRHGYVTTADFVRGRFDSRGLALAVALTGILATMPYVALQLVGIQAVLDAIGVGGAHSTWLRDLPLFIAFALLAAYTYTAGLRAPALIAFVKDTLIYVVIIVAVIYLPIRLGGWDHIFTSAGHRLAAVNPATGTRYGSLTTGPTAQWSYATLALGSAMALFMYPHASTGVLAASSRTVVRRTTAVLPLYSLMLGLLALLGYLALAAGVKPAPGHNNVVVPLLFGQLFPSWFAGVAFAAIGIGALVPAAIMSIAAANLFTRNIYREYLRPNASHSEETRVSKLASLVVKVGGLAFVLGLDPAFSINLQLLGGIWILQTFPAVVFGLYTRWFHRWALLAGWAVAMCYGTWEAYRIPTPGKPGSHFGGSSAPVPLLHHNGYIALTAFVLNVVVATGLTLILRAVQAPAGQDRTAAADYVAETGDEEVSGLPQLV